MAALFSRAAPTQGLAKRVDWVDYSKGICIILVVMMHSVLGTELAAGATGYMHAVVEFAKPFRMPDFFLLSGLFLGVVIKRDWRTYFDRKVVHFAYFYVLWVTIQFAFKATTLAAGQGLGHLASLYLMAFIEPFGTLWFIYLLPIFFIATRMTVKVPVALMLGLGAALEMAQIHTGWTVPDEFAARFIYFYAGYVFAPQIFALSDYFRARPTLALTTIAVWFTVNLVLVNAELSTWPGISLALGFAGALAIVIIGTLLAKAHWLDGLRMCGEHSIVIYLAFFIPMAISRIALLKFGGLDVGTTALLVSISAVVGAMIIWRVALRLRMTFLFERPAMFWLTPKRPVRQFQPAE